MEINGMLVLDADFDGGVVAWVTDSGEVQLLVLEKVNDRHSPIDHCAAKFLSFAHKVADTIRKCKGGLTCLPLRRNCSKRKNLLGK